MNMVLSKHLGNIEIRIVEISVVVARGTLRGVAIIAAEIRRERREKKKRGKEQRTRRK
tara:strand:- start:694 stop:867 length:174 start_codon:yes stop_codon:yes gene_type:complete